MNSPWLRLATLTVLVAGGGAAVSQLPDEFSAEQGLLLRKGGLSALQVRDFLSGEFTPLPMHEVMAVLRAREASGAIRLVPKAKR